MYTKSVDFRKLNTEEEKRSHALARTHSTNAIYIDTNESKRAMMR